MAGKIDFSKRSNQKELLDRDDIPFPDIEKNMLELDVINTWLGGHAISIRGMRRLIGDRRHVHLCEIGAGGGDNLRVLSRWCKQRGIEVSVTGIDSNPHCVEVARRRWIGDNAQWVCSDYRQVSFTGGRLPDIIFSSLFCHHFTGEELAAQLRWMEMNAGAGWFINDLQRHPAAYYSIKLLTAVFSGSYLVRNDAPLSVLRGFSKAEWRGLLTDAGIGKNALIQWQWAFRWLVTRNIYV